jgi:complement component 1 Q subcomponent-binding protein
VTVTVSVEDEPEEPWGEDDDYEGDEEDDAPAKAGDSSAAGEEDEDDLDDEDLAVFFDVKVAKKKGQALQFQCVTDGVNVDIVSVQLVADGQAASPAAQDAAYGGPEFSTLDVSLQDAFAGYLAERGVDHVLAEYLVELSIDKEQREYTNWLKGCAKFVGGGK